jgi:hypothetical protein
MGRWRAMGGVGASCCRRYHCRPRVSAQPRWAIGGMIGRHGDALTRASGLLRDSANAWAVMPAGWQQRCEMRAKLPSILCCAAIPAFGRGRLPSRCSKCAAVSYSAVLKAIAKAEDGIATWRSLCERHFAFPRPWRADRSSRGSLGLPLGPDRVRGKRPG